MLPHNIDYYILEYADDIDAIIDAFNLKCEKTNNISNVFKSSNEESRAFLA